ncbi:hypothetical protein BSL78_22173 [Apostichopus japonicus]|uniref:Uncharacterized protein n=1 Tax=Stichopus japonicus TaxID=307972 RepID=A0A2G8JYY2_STIJA|nr:hypothetical protein BSL78_22173 [Apostichopus japonicus]
MSQNAYHWEALRKQRVIDRRTEALKRREEYEAQQEAVRTEAAAREEAERQKREVSRQKVLKDQVDHRNWSAVKKSTNDRNSSPRKQTYHYRQGHRTLKVDV